MVITLIRTDSFSPKIQLVLGTYPIGRGNLLQCDDKRVSRNHGELDVTNDNLLIKALHQNPCFYIKNGTEKKEVLKQNNTTTLLHGDKFGLLPDTYWYEIVNVNDVGSDPQTLSNCEENTEPLPTADDDNGAHTEQKDFNETIDVANSQSLLDPKPEIPAINGIGDVANPVEETNGVNSPNKRSHSPENEETAKKIKTEDVKQEPNNSTAGPSNDDPKAAVGTADPQTPTPNNIGRERCIYGANCYRRNPQHRVQFSHPADADWGDGERGECPYGRLCRRRDPRHWHHHRHPEGTAPPPPHPHNPGVRRKQRKRAKEESDDDVPTDVIVTGKRARRPVASHTWSEESGNEDPFQTDESDEWQPDSAETPLFSQDID